MTSNDFDKNVHDDPDPLPTNNMQIELLVVYVCEWQSEIEFNFSRV